MATCNTDLLNATDLTTTEIPKILTLNVGGRCFTVSKDILIAESGLFRHQLSDRFHWAPEADGTYFLDADPELFEHLLRVMRRPTTFPLFWSQAQGFDYNLYHHLEGEAEYFQMHTLYEWLRQQKYLQAVRITTHYEIQPLDSLDIADNQLADRSDALQILPQPKTKSIYVCPRDIRFHRGSPEKCGRDCRRAQGDEPDIYVKELHFEVMKISKQLTFHKNICEMA